MKNTAIDRRAHPEGAALSTWIAPDGWPLRRMDWPQPGGAVPRGSILFANGRGDFIEKYLEPLAHWHGRGWNVASFDWRGQGASSGSIAGGNIDSFDPLVDDLDALVEVWREEMPGPHVVIGHSMGGHLLLRWLAEKEAGIDAAVLVAPMLSVNAGKLSPRLARLVAAAASAIGLKERRVWKAKGGGRFRQAFLTGSAERYEDELWWKTREPGYDLGPPSWGWLAAAFRSTGGLRPSRLRRIATPILILAAERDRLVSTAAIKEAARLLPNAELHVYADAAHEILRERDEIRLDALARVDGFLDRRASR